MHDGVLRLSVDDRCYELSVEQGVARCAEVDREPQLRLSLRTLGSLYLGSTPASRVARAGLVQGSERALAEADRLLIWPVASWCPEIF
jgi:predicted acetyltransferase